MRVAFLTNIVSPYRLPVFERLAATPGWNLRVIVNAASEFDRSWTVDTRSLDVRVCRTWSIKRKVISDVPVRFEQTITLHVPTGLFGELQRFDPDVVISHELGPRSMAAAAWCKLRRRKLVIWSYQSRVSATQGHSRRAAVRRALLRAADQVVGMGQQTRDVLCAWGCRESTIVDAPNAADHVTILNRLRDPETERGAAEIRSRFGGRKLACVVGRLTPLKGTAEMLAAWHALPGELRAQWQLLFLGDGPLESFVNEQGGPGVSCVGFVPTREMAAWYRACDLHVFPTLGDVWGLVVNEAMACGVPTLCSRHAGCSDDLIEDGRTGLLCDPTRPGAFVDELAAAMCRDDLAAIGEAGARHVGGFTLDRLADGFRTAVARATETGDVAAAPKRRAA